MEEHSYVRHDRAMGSSDKAIDSSGRTSSAFLMCQAFFPANTEHQNIRFPDLGTKEKNVKKTRKSQAVPLSYSEMNESNDNFDSSQ